MGVLTSVAPASAVLACAASGLWAAARRGPPLIVELCGRLSPGTNGWLASAAFIRSTSAVSSASAGAVAVPPRPAPAAARSPA